HLPCVARVRPLAGNRHAILMQCKWSQGKSGLMRQQNGQQHKQAYKSQQERVKARLKTMFEAVLEAETF
ncbi:MAG: hypothetical protein ACO363_09525, partial [Balneolaceae bacterium]